MYPLTPVGASAVVLGDGEFDGPTLQHTVQDSHWFSWVRAESNILVTWDGERFRRETVAACTKPGTLIERTDVRVTEAAYDSESLLCCWAIGYLGHRV